jgi:bifunctional polynucleotide phosphatase/kinase
MSSYSVVFISNQAGHPAQQKAFKDKLPLLCRHLKIPLHAFAAFDRDIYRKPCTGIWDSFVENFNGGIEIGASCCSSALTTHSVSLT